MALNQSQQFFELVKKSRNILIVFRQNFSIDTVTSAMALSLLLKKMGKNSELVCADWQLPKNLLFLPKINIQSKLANLKKFIINLDLKENKINELSYEVDGNKLHVFITPETGNLTAEDITTDNGNFKYDLILTVNTPDMESLGKIYENNSELFYQTPIINIDHQPDNEDYGQINLVELAATATSEVIYDLLESLSGDFLDDQIALCLLTGIIASTHSFKKPDVTPHTLNIASRLITAGADREMIIQHLYRSRSLATLKLWGRVLARLENDSSHQLAWSVIGQQDFLYSGAGEENLPDVIDELISSSPEIRVIALIYEQQPDQICCLIKTQKPSEAKLLQNFLSGNLNDNELQFCLADKNLIIAKDEIVEKIKQALSAHQRGQIK